MGGMARRAFEHRWIDAEPRTGKRGGAFCMSVEGVEESRILANFDGSFDQVSTLAHELGHAYHNHCQRGLPSLLRGAPSTLAETASIFCETIMVEAGLAATPLDQRLGLLDTDLQGACQVVVDIHSRFLFERELCTRREQQDLSVADLLDAPLLRSLGFSSRGG